MVLEGIWGMLHQKWLGVRDKTEAVQNQTDQEKVALVYVSLLTLLSLRKAWK